VWKYLASFMVEEMLNLSIRRIPKLGRVGSPFAHLGKGWGIVRCAIAFVMLMSFATVSAQGAPCGLVSMEGATPLQYPPIARAAQVSGDVIFLVKFGPSGSVDDLTILSGPQILRESATTYVKSLRTNSQNGTRQCPFVVGFRTLSTPPCENIADPAIPFQTTDVQHVVVRTGTVWLCDPAADIHRRKRFLFF
jgi:hypothetical protein